MSVLRVSSVMVRGPVGPVACDMRPAVPGAPTLVLLHGIQGTAAAWRGVCARLPEAWGLVLPDLRGRGQSASPDDPEAYGLEGFAADLAAVIDACPGPVVLVGWSMGVLVSLAYIATYGAARLEKLVLASGTAAPGPEARWFQGTDAASIATEARARAERLALTASARPEAVAGAWMSARRTDLRPVLGQVSVPTLVLHGGRDDQCPVSHGEALGAGISGAVLSVWPQGGHNLMAEDPDGVASALMAFCVKRAKAAPKDGESLDFRGQSLDDGNSF